MYGRNYVLVFITSLHWITFHSYAGIPVSPSMMISYSDSHTLIFMYTTIISSFYKCMQESRNCQLFLSPAVNGTYTANSVKTKCTTVKQICPEYRCVFLNIERLEEYNGLHYPAKVLCEIQHSNIECTCTNNSFVINWQNENDYFNADGQMNVSEPKANCSWYKKLDNFTKNDETNCPTFKNSSTSISISVSIVCVLSLIILAVCIVKYRAYICEAKDGFIKRKCQLKKGNDIDKKIYEGQNNKLTCPSSSQYTVVELTNDYCSLRENVKHFQHDYDSLPFSDAGRSLCDVDTPLQKLSSASGLLGSIEGSIAKQNTISFKEESSGVYTLAKVL